MSRCTSNPKPKYERPDHNVYQVTTIQKNKQPVHPYHVQKRYQRQASNLAATSIDIGYSEGTASETCYDCCEQNDPTYQHNPLRESRATFSDDSCSTRLPSFEFDEESNRGCAKSGFAEHPCRQSRRYPGVGMPKEASEAEERLYHEIQTPCDNGPMPVAPIGRRFVASRLSDRPQSSMSSVLTSTMFYGCGGKCQTLESVCYFVLQLLFAMGILIGMSLCIAGLVLRNSAARNLQVLLYIGFLLAAVSGVLWSIQCRAKNSARRRIKAIQTAKRAPIQMETLNIRANPVHNLERLPSIREAQNINHLPQIHHTRTIPRRPQRRPNEGIVIQEEPGIPWWRRNEI
ncbi:uncharacterized protein LOC109544425 isoform X1 [Dendroctonus ponderosae]|uniref:uncharacterized protein LOC109544425 isoform X1 n=2 Tax=Dendroctonus ponderosae TaxID=77166 RepID=UPI0020353972|nr:uncharacterized protein LOC109544425 isoform X1 [Dendroctonus ponderosae]